MEYQLVQSQEVIDKDVDLITTLYDSVSGYTGAGLLLLVLGVAAVVVKKFKK